MYSESFTAPFSTFSQVDLPVTKNTYTIFSKFCHKGFGDLFVTHISRKNRVFCTLRIVFKNFSVFPWTFWLFIVLSVHLSHKLTVFSLKIHHFSSSSLLQTSRKGMGFLFFSKYFMFIAFDFLIFEFLLRFENMMFEYGLGNFFFLLSLLYGFCWSWLYDAYFTCFHAYFSFLSCIFCWCYVVHIISMVKCLIGIFLYSWGFHGIQWL